MVSSTGSNHDKRKTRSKARNFSPSRKGFLLAEDLGSNLTSTSSSQSDSGVDCNSNHSNGSDIQGPSTSSESPGITLRSHKVLGADAKSPVLNGNIRLSSPRSTRQCSRESQSVSSSQSSENIRRSVVEPRKIEFVRKDQFKRDPIKMTFRMKRSAVFDEVIESGQNCFMENGHASSERNNSSNSDEMDVPYAPHYEILRFDGTGSPVNSPNRMDSPVGSESPQPSSIVQVKKKNKKRNKNKRKHRSKQKEVVEIESLEQSREDLDAGDQQSREVTTTSPPNGSKKRIRLIIGTESCTIDIPPVSPESPSSPESH